MIEKIERRTFFKGREIVAPKGFPVEIINDERKRIGANREYTLNVKDINPVEKQRFAMIADKYSFPELLVSKEQMRPGIEPNFPTIVTIPDRYPANYAIIHKFVPKNRLVEGISTLFLGLRLNSVGESAKHQNNFGLIISEEKMLFIKKLEEFQSTFNHTDRALGETQLMKLVLRSHQLNLEKKVMLKGISDYEQKQEEITDRQLMKETPDIDSIASMMLIDSMLSRGANEVGGVLEGVRRVQKKDRPSVLLTEKFILYLQKKYPYAHMKTLEKLTESYIKIGGEILERFDAWEKENKRKN